MRADHLETYLNNHLTAADGALDMLDMLASDADAPNRWTRVAREIHDEVAADKQTFEVIMQQAGIEKKTLRHVIGWLGEKAAELKLRWDDPSAGPLHHFEAVEALALGVRGKWLLWQGLGQIQTQDPDAFEGVDFDNLMQRAENQYQQLDAWRLDLVARAL